MNAATSNNRRLRSTLITLAALLALLLQVQSVFACEMMDLSGPAEDCCCEEMAGGRDDCAEPCCDFDSELSLVGSDLQAPEPALPLSKTSPELPQTAMLPAPPPLWPPSAAPPQEPLPPELDSKPTHPGTLTWLATRRLRI